MEKKLKFSTKVGYGVGDLGCNLVFTTAGSFLTLYYTDSVMLSAAFVGTMMLVARILDGISDIVMGTIIDRTHTKMGKARPYVLFGSIFLVLSFLLLFNVPQSLGIQGKQVYATITYIMMAVVCYTVVNLAYSTLITLMSPDQDERNSLSSVRMFFSFLAVLVINSFTSNLVAQLGGGQEGFSKLAIIYGAIAFVCLVITGLVSKEYVSEKADDISVAEKVPVKETAKLLFTNKYTYLCGLAFIFNWMHLTLNGAASVYYARDVLGNIGMMSALSICGMLPSMILLAVVPKAAYKFGKQRALIFGAAMIVIGFLLPTLQATNVPVVLAGCVFKGIGLAFVNALLFASVADLCDYIQMTSGKQIAGITNSVISFGMKVGTGFGSAILGWMLAWGQYDEQLANAFQPQSAQTVTAEIMCFAGIPLGCALITLICTIFLDVSKKLEKRA